MAATHCSMFKLLSKITPIYVAASVRGIHNLTINRCEREELRDWTILQSYDQKLCLVTIKFKFVQRHSCHNIM